MRPTPALSLAVLLLLLAVPAASLAQTPPGAPLSSIEVPIALPVARLEQWIEQQAPRGDDHWQSWQPLDNQRGAARWEIRRGPIKLSVSGSTVTLETELSYRAAACVNLPGVLGGSCKQVISCGERSLRTLRARVESTLEVSPDYHLTARTGIAAQPGRRCRVTALGIDITPFVLRRYLGKIARLVDQKIAEGTRFRPVVERVWARAWQPVGLGQGMHLLLRPVRLLATTPGSLDGRTLMARVGLSARPELRAGPPPAAAVVPALPALSTVPGTPGVRIAATAVLPYPELGGLLEARLRGRDLPVAGTTLRIERVRIRLLGGDRVELELGVAKGPFGGTVRVKARPILSGMRLGLTDLEVGLQAAGGTLATRPGAYFVDLKEHLGGAASWDVTPYLEVARRALAAGLAGAPAGKVAGGIRLAGAVSGVRLVAVRAAPAAFEVGAQLDGQLSLTID